MIEEHGRLDILVNNAGVTVDRPVWKMSADDWHKVLRVNLSGAFYMTKPAIMHMLDRGSGRIINISSVTGEIGNIGQANYTASKSGLFGLTKTLAREAAFALRASGKLDNGIGLTVNAVTPGLIETDMVATIPPFMLNKLLKNRSRCTAWASPTKSRRVVELPRPRRLQLHHRTDLGRQRRTRHVIGGPAASRRVPAAHGPQTGQQPSL